MGPFARHKTFILLTILSCAAGVGIWFLTRTWHGWEYILTIVGKGDNMPIAGLVPIIIFFTYLHRNGDGCHCGLCILRECQHWQQQADQQHHTQS